MTTHEPGTGPGIRKKNPAKRVKAAHRRYRNGGSGTLSLRAWAENANPHVVGDETYDCITLWLKRKRGQRNKR